MSRSTNLALAVPQGSIEIRPFENSSQEYFYNKFINNREVSWSICALLEVTRGFSYDDKIFFRTHYCNHIIRVYAESSDYMTKIAAQLWRQDGGKHSLKYYKDEIEHRNFFDNLKNILLLIVGATISPDQNESDSERLEAWYQNISRFGKVALGHSAFEADVAARIYLELMDVLLWSCLAAQGGDANRQDRNHDTLFSLYWKSRPLLLAPFLRDRKLGTTRINPFKPTEYETFITEFRRLCPKSAEHFIRAFDVAQEKYIPNDQGLLSFVGAYHVSLASIFSIILYANKDNYSSRALLTLGFLALSFIAMSVSFFYIPLEGKIKREFLKHFELKAIMPAQLEEVPKEQKPQVKRVLMPAIPVVPISGYEINFYLDSGGRVQVLHKKTATRLAREQRAASPPSVTLFQQPQPEEEQHLEGFSVEMNGERYTFSAKEPALGIPINYCDREGFYYTVKSGIDIPDEILNKFTVGNRIEIQKECNVFSMKFSGTNHDTRLYANTIDTGIKGCTLYMITLYEPKAHVRAGKIPTATLERAELTPHDLNSIHVSEGTFAMPVHRV